MPELAAAYVSLVATAKGLDASLTREFSVAERRADSAGAAAGKKYADSAGKAASGLSKGIAEKLNATTAIAGTKGTEAGTKFAQSAARATDGLGKSIAGSLDGASSLASAKGTELGKKVSTSAVAATEGAGRQMAGNLTPPVSAMTAKGKEIGGKISAGAKSRIGELAKTTLAPLLALGATAGAADFLRDAISEARESQKVGAQTGAVIKSTGAAAKVSADQVGDLATAISNKTGIDDEAIQSGQNLLLTFTGIRNEAGKGNDVFNQSSELLVDMATAMGQQPKDAAVQLGKALNDPVKGMTALSKVGVSFTAQQKATNKALVEGGDANALMAMGIINSQADIRTVMTQRKLDFNDAVAYMTKDFDPAQQKMFQHLSEGGNTMEAQKVILTELKKEFGGSAAAQATAGEKLATTWANFKETVGTALIPLIDSLLPKLQTAIQWMMDNFPKLQAGISGVVGWFQRYKDIIIPVAGVMGALIGAWKTYSAVTKVAGAVQATFNAIMAANPIGLVVIAIAGLVAGFIVMYNKVGWFRDFVNAAWAAIKNSAMVVVNWFKTTAWPWMQQAFQAIGKSAMWLWQNAILPAWRGIQIAVQFAWNNVILPAWKAISWYIQSILIPYVKLLWNVWSTAFKVIWTVVKFAWENVIRPAFAALKAYITGVVIPIIKFLWQNVFAPAFSAIGAIVKGAWENVIKPAFDAIKTAVGKVRDTFSTVVGAIKNIWGGLSSALSTPIDAVIRYINSPFISGLNAILSHIPGVSFRVPSIPTIGASSGGGKGLSPGSIRSGSNRNMATGGILPGYTPGRDVHSFYSPALGTLNLSGGEAILRPEATRALGAGWVNQINAAARGGGVAGVRSTMGFSSGGIFGWIGDKLSGAWDFVKNAASVATQLITDPIGLAGKVVTGLLSGVGNSFAGQMVIGTGKKIAEGLGSAISGMFSGGGGPAGAEPGSGAKSSAYPTSATGAAVGGGYPQRIPTLIALGRQLQSMGYSVGENPAFGGVHPVHMRGSYHYIGQAIDVNHGAGTSAAETAAINRILPLVMKYGLAYVWQSKGHYDHLHVDTRRGYYYHDHWYNYANGGIPVFDNGGTLAPGINVVNNKLGRPEPLVRADHGGSIDGAELFINVGGERVMAKVVTKRQDRDARFGQVATIR